jgi:hypothetical protein
MDTTAVRKFRWFWAWQDHEEEAWLEEMARNGLHLRSGGGIAGRHLFEAGKPADVVYRLDYTHPIFAGRDRSRYPQMIQDAGWEHVQDVFGWRYFRKPREPGGVNEIYADSWSRAGKYRRLMSLLGLLGTVPLLESLSRGGYVRAFSSVLLLMFSYALVRIKLRMHEVQ